MQKFNKLVVALAVCGGLMVSSGEALASDCHQPKCFYKTVIVYETVKKPCIQYVIKIDDCGEPYVAKVVTYKKVQVPVEKQVKICY